MTIYVECKPDVVLVKALGFASRTVQHRATFGKGEVVKRLDPDRGDRLLIEEDPVSAQPGAIKGLPVEELTDENLKVIRKGQSVVIVICPNLEEWLLRLARLAEINPEDYGLPREPQRLHKVINKRQDNLEKFLESLVENPESKKILKKLQSLLREV